MVTMYGEIGRLLLEEPRTVFVNANYGCNQDGRKWLFWDVFRFNASIKCQCRDSIVLILYTEILTEI